MHGTCIKTTDVYYKLYYGHIFWPNLVTFRLIIQNSWKVPYTIVLKDISIWDLNFTIKPIYLPCQILFW